jgi:hypothetical protein
MTDGDQNMVSENSGFKKLFTDNIGHSAVPYHCIIHQEVLCAKSGLLNVASPGRDRAQLATGPHPSIFQISAF